MAPTPEQIKKLPVWAQEHIKRLEGQRESAINTANRAFAEQEPSPIYVEYWAFTGEDGRSGPVTKRRYVHGHRVEVVHQGVQLAVTLRDDCIDLQWSQAERSMSGDVCFQPWSYQNARLITKEKMR